jgi:tRNA-dihydrouridine synthase
MSAGREVLLQKLKLTEAERPIVAQIFSSKPEMIRGAVALVRELGFDGVDINMGCPDRAVMKQGAGSALIDTPDLAREIIRAAKEGAEGMPVSVKTRLGVKKDELERWLPVLLAEKPAAITIHCRTAKEMSKVPARWDRIAVAVKLRDSNYGSGTSIIGNGDVWSLEQGRKLAEETGADGIMIGRAAIGNPFVFSGKKPMTEELLNAMVEHAVLFEKIKMEEVSSATAADESSRDFAPIRKHLTKYCHGIRGAKELREKVLHAGNAEEVREIVKNFL